MYRWSVIRQRTLVAMIVLATSSDLLAGPVNPPVTTGLLVGLDGSDVTTTGSLVDSWNDQVANGGSNDATQAGTARPVLVPAGLNGYDTLRFDGSNDFMDIAADSDFDTDTLSWFIVFKADTLPSVGTAGVLLSSAYTSTGGASSAGSKNNLWLSFITGNSGGLFSTIARDKSGNPFFEGTPSQAGDFFVLSGVWRADDTVGQFINGVPGSGTNSSPDAIPAGHKLSRIGAQINDPSPPTFFFDGEYAEILIYTTELNNSDRLSVQSYLGSKYAIAIVPEPASATLALLAGVFLALHHRRRAS